MIIGIDFDSTIIKHAFPFAKEEAPGAIDVIKKIKANGHKIIMITMREHYPVGECKDALQEAIDWCTKHGIVFDRINSNYEDSPFYPSSSTKIYADIYIDDCCLGIKKIDYFSPNDSCNHPYVDWKEIDKLLVNNGVYKDSAFISKEKYEFTDKAIVCDGHELHRIKALKDFGDVKKGYLGGFVEKESNLSQLGDCWVYNDAKVYGNARVSENAIVCVEAKVFDDAEVCGNARVCGNTNVCGDAQVYGDARIYDYAWAFGNARINGFAQICGNAQVKSIGDYAVFQNNWSSGRWFTWTKSNDMWKVGCFYGTGEELIKKAYKDSEESGKKYQAIVNVVKKIASEEKKFELTDKTREWHGHTLYRIKALKDFSHVKKGDLGGWIEKEDNLSQDGICWIGDDAKVYGNAKVFGKAQVFGEAKIEDNAEIYGNAQVFCSACVYGNAQVYGNVHVCGHALVFDNAKVCGNAEICASAKVYGKVYVHRNAIITEDAEVFGYAEIYDNVKVKSIDDYMVFKNSWSSGRWFTWTKSNNMWREEYFYGTGEELIKKAYKESEESGKKYEAIVNMVNVITSF